MRPLAQDDFLRDGPALPWSPKFGGLVIDDRRAILVHQPTEVGLYVVYLNVHPDHRREGLATSLVNALGGPLALHVRVDNAPAIALYDRLGFKTHRREPGFYVAVDGLLMLRP